MVSVTDRSSLLPDSGVPEFGAWLEGLRIDWSEAERGLLAHAWETAERVLGAAKRASGESYFLHAVAVASILVELTRDAESIAAALLHDVLRGERLSPAELKHGFGPTIAALVDGVSRMDVITEYQLQLDQTVDEAEQNEALRKMLLAMAQDVRVVLIKLAERLHDMRTLKGVSDDVQKRVAQETADIYAPLANRLGIWQVKWELEDLSLRFSQPDVYKEIAKLLDERRASRESYIANVINELTSHLAEQGITADITGRPKHIYSIWRKMKRKAVDFDKIFDVRAVRLLVADVPTCYAVLGVVHSLWRHIPGEFDDYIANPKENNYQSLHTAVFGPEGKVLEVQIRTQDMHHHAELGVAAHWRYKEGGQQDQRFEKKIAWLRQILDHREQPAAASEIIERLKAAPSHENVYVLTPKGEIIELPHGATPLDFAYTIHTDIGHRCRGAKVNNKLVPLTYELRSGDQVEILTIKEGGPSRDWLTSHAGFVRTGRARSKIKLWFRQQAQEENVSAGRQAFERECHRLGVEPGNIDQLAQQFSLRNAEDFFAALGRGDIGLGQVARHLDAGQTRPELTEIEHNWPARVARKGDITVSGEDDLLTQMARCCKPVPYDPIVGFITRGRGVTIHHRDCPNLQQLSEDDQQRLIGADWGRTITRTYPVDIYIEAYDRQGLLRDITSVLANERVNVLSAHTDTDKRDYIARLNMTIEISDLSHLSRVIHRINSLPNIREVGRRN
jgi:GTP pyrophosphokinase